jgi:peptide-methionine (S)-S-oxide reductase
MKRAIHLLLTLGALAVCAAVEPAKTTMTTMNTADTNKTELATFGGGCFWCQEAVFRELAGVKSVASGYAGGRVPNPTYQQVCTGKTGHAEVIQIEFDPQKTSCERLLAMFWKLHDPTTLNRQGPDTGTQYRSIILYHNEAQKQAAEKSKAEAQKHFNNPIVTEIVPLQNFYRAEEYHQDYFHKNPHDAYCRINIPPKLEKLEKLKAAQAKP